MSELKKCPCCGSKADFQVNEEGTASPFNGGWWIQCTNPACALATNIVFPEKTDAKPLLAEKWNRRHAESALAAELDGAAKREKRLESEIEHYIQAVGKYCERDEIHRKNWLKAEDECKALRARLERAAKIAKRLCGDIEAAAREGDHDNRNAFPNRNWKRIEKDMKEIQAVFAAEGGEKKGATDGQG